MSLYVEIGNLNAVYVFNFSFLRQAYFLIMVGTEQLKVLLSFDGMTLKDGDMVCVLTFWFQHYTDLSYLWTSYSRFLSENSGLFQTGHIKPWTYHQKIFSFLQQNLPSAYYS